MKQKFLWFVLMLWLPTFLLAQIDSTQADKFIQEAKAALEEGHYELAHQKYTTAAAIYQKQGLSSKATIASLRAIRAVPNNQKKEAIEALKEWQSNPSNNTEANIRATIALAHCYKDIGNLNEALKLLKKGVLEGEKASLFEKKELAQLYLQLANLYFFKREANQFNIYFEKAKTWWKELYSTENTDWFPLWNLQVLQFNMQGKGAEALALIDKMAMLAIREKGSQSPLLASVYSTKARFYYGAKELLKSIEFQEKAVAIYEKTYKVAHIKTAQAYLNLGTYNKDYKPKGFYKDPSIKPSTYWTNAIDYTLKGISVFEEIFQGRHPNISVAYRNVASIYAMDLRPKNFEKAQFYLNKSMEAVLLNYKFPDLYSVPDFSKAENRVCLDDEKVARVLWLNAEFNLNQFKTKKKDIYMERGLANLGACELFLTEVEKGIVNKDDLGWVLGTLRRVYSYYITFYSNKYRQTKAQKHLHKIFEYSEKSKSVILLQTLNSEETGVMGGLPKEMLSAEKEVKQLIGKYQAQLNAATEKRKNASVINDLQDKLLAATRSYDQLIQSLQLKYPTYFELKYQRQSVSIERVQEQLLDDSTALLSFHQLNNWKNGFPTLLVCKDSIYLHYVGGKNIVKKINKFIDLILDVKSLKEDPRKAYQNFWEASFAFYSRLLKLDKLLSKRPEIKRLIIIPDQALNFLPFEMLLTQKPEGLDTTSEDYNQLAFMIKSYTISYAYSATVLLQIRERKTISKKGGILGFAASYNSQEAANSTRSPDLNNLRAALNDLPGAKEELTHLSKNYAGKYFFGEEASEKVFKQLDVQKYSILHLAMHGMLDSKNPMSSGLVFTEDGDSIEDNFLRAYEITSMNLPFDLVVLSACQTGLGQIANGEGVIGLARAFAYAGSPSVLMTLWEVNDYSTNQIMMSFYEQLAAGVARDQALTNAKLDYLARAEGIAKHPFFWAPFVLTGEAGPIKLKTKGNPLFWYIGIAVAFLIVGLGAWAIMRKRKKA